MSPNSKLKRKIKSKKIKLWEVAEKIGMHDSNFSRMLRYKLSDDQLKIINIAINDLESEKNERKHNIEC